MHLLNDGAPTYALAMTFADRALRQRISQQQTLRMQAHFAAEGRVSTFFPPRFTLNARLELLPRSQPALRPPGPLAERVCKMRRCRVTLQIGPTAESSASWDSSTIDAKREFGNRLVLGPVLLRFLDISLALAAYPRNVTKSKHQHSASCRNKKPPIRISKDAAPIISFPMKNPTIGTVNTA